MKIIINKYLRGSFSVFMIFFSLINLTTNNLKAEESFLKQMEIDSSTKPSDDALDLPSNPFQLVEMIRRANSMNDATNPSDAIDDALKAFDSIEDKDLN